MTEGVDVHQDDLQRLLAQKLRDPDFRALYDDLRARHEVLDTLVRTRSANRLPQEVMAKRMDISQPTVSEFESESSDPRLSTVQRYARALGGRIEVRFVPDPLADLP